MPAGSPLAVSARNTTEVGQVASAATLRDSTSSESVWLPPIGSLAYACVAARHAAACAGVLKSARTTEKAAAGADDMLAPRVQ